jgi:hypothetical protein
MLRTERPKQTNQGSNGAEYSNFMNRLYKFISDSAALPFILRGLIKFTPPAELNDPSELTPNVIPDEVMKSLDRLRRNGYTEEDIVNLRLQQNLFQRLAPQFQVVRAPDTPQGATDMINSSFYDQISILELRLSEMLREVSCKVGLFCLSLRYDSLPMWAHYARNANGLVVEFRDLDTVFHGDDTGVLFRPIPVRYERDQLSVTFDTQSHHSLFFSKFPDWKYEKEVRVVLPLADCRKEVITSHQLNLWEIPRHCISRLILGWNMPKDARTTIHEYVQQLNPQVDMIEARIIRGQVTLEADG